MAIKLEYVPVANYTKETVCPHNAACRCTVQNCFRCGWNPKVAKMRMEKILSQKTEG
jgi:hypothetical protein